jgi:D-alanyl-D-alanine dipeptidase
MMKKAGFHRHPNEWWHFCLGDQMWVWLSQSTEGVNKPQIAYYGGVL